MMMPGEMIVSPAFAPIAKALNDGRKLTMRAGGGVAYPKWMTEAVDLGQQYAAVNPTLSPLPIPANVVHELKLQIDGGFNREVLDALIEEVRGLRAEVRGQRSDLVDLPDRINIKLPSEIEMKADGREIRAVIRRDEMLNQ